MAIVDIIVLSVIALSCMFGGFRGLVKEALSLTFWILAAILASTFDEQLGTKLTVISAGNPGVRRIAAFALIFIGTVFAGGMISNLVSRLTSAAGLGGADRALGALFGIVRGIVIVTIVVMITIRFEAIREWYGGSLLVPYALTIADFFLNLLGIDPAAAVNTSA